jgi:hypothetical protein
LEARFAVFFDGLGIEWEYEVEGFVLDNGEWYLPDFLLPTFNGGMWVEVKPKAFTKEEKEKCRLLCIGTKKGVWLAAPRPDFICYEVYYYDEPYGFLEGEGIPNADQAEFENRMFAFSAYGEIGGMINIEYRSLMGNRLPFAVLEARQARFEHKNKNQ